MEREYPSSSELSADWQGSQASLKTDGISFHGSQQSLHQSTILHVSVLSRMTRPHHICLGKSGKGHFRYTNDNKLSYLSRPLAFGIDRFKQAMDTRVTRN